MLSPTVLYHMDCIKRMQTNGVDNLDDAVYTKRKKWKKWITTGLIEARTLHILLKIIYTCQQKQQRDVLCKPNRK